VAEGVTQTNSTSMVSKNSQTTKTRTTTSGTSPSKPITQNGNSQTVELPVGVPVNVSALVREIESLKTLANQRGTEGSALKQKIAILEANAKKKKLTAEQLSKNLNAARKEKDKLKANTSTQTMAQLEIPRQVNTPLSSARSGASSTGSINRNIQKHAARMPSPAPSVVSPSASPNVKSQLQNLIKNKQKFLLKSNLNPVTRGRLQSLISSLAKNGTTYNNDRKRQKLLDIYYELQGTKPTNKLTLFQLTKVLKSKANYLKLYNKIRYHVNSLTSQRSNRPSSAASSSASTFRVKPTRESPRLGVPGPGGRFPGPRMR